MVNLRYRAHNWVDISGQRFGRWTAIKFHPHVGKPKRSGKWECLCDCGNRGMVIYAQLKLGNSRSCGCLRTEVSRAQCSTGNGPRRVLPYGVAAFKRVHYLYRRHATERGLEWQLTVAESVRLFRSNCHYCGTPPSTVQAGAADCGDFVYNGIDRVDNSRGYTVSNCVSCCKQCNFAKAAMPYEVFTAWLDQVVDARMKLRVREEAVA